MEETKDRIFFLRNSLGLNSTKFAKMLEVSQPCVKKWESGRCLPEGKQLIKLYEVFKACPNWVLLGIHDLSDTCSCMNKQ